MTDTPTPPPDDREAARALVGLDALGDIADTLAVGADFRRDARAFLHQVLGTLVASKGAVYLYDAQDRALCRIADRGMTDSRIELDVGAVRTLSGIRAPVRARETPLGDLPPEDLLAPLALKGQLLGLLRLGPKFMGQAYSTGDLDLLKVIALNTSVALYSEGLIQTAREASMQLRRKVLEMETLRDVGIEISALRDLRGLCSEILERAIALIAARAGALYLYHPARKTFDAVATFGGARVPDRMPDDGEPGRRWMMETEPLLSDTEVSALGGEKSALAIAIRSKGEVLGSLLLVDKEGRSGIESFSEEDGSLLAGFAIQAAVAIDNARLHEAALEQERTQKELQLAAEIQRNLLPQQMPAIPGYELTAMTRPCHTVGGDYYDFLPLPGGRTLLIVADVAGKGIPAALLVFTLNATLHALVGELAEGMPLPDFVRDVNEAVYRTSISSRFITAFIGILDPERGVLVSVNAGHNPPILLNPNRDEPRELKRGGLCLGMFEEARYEQEITELVAGDTLALYSDGVTEAQDDDAEEFGVERLTDALTSAPAPDVQSRADSVDRAVEKFVKGAHQFDDLTLVILRRLVD